MNQKQQAEKEAEDNQFLQALLQAIEEFGVSHKTFTTILKVRLSAAQEATLRRYGWQNDENGDNMLRSPDGWV